ncbi:MAG TPA: hypothetical protein VKP30_23595 [Polyangiaceae bacterium]|nr:hypothetical protein [Polyangiaceae bacterium]
MMNFRFTMTALALLLTSFAAREAKPAAQGSQLPNDELGMQERALAEALFQEGKRLGEEGRIAEACAKFEESERLESAPGTLIHLGACYAEAGKTASAWAAFLAVAELAERAHDSAREALARRLAGEVEPRLSLLALSVRQPARGMTIHVDGHSLGNGGLNTALPMDPGEHLVEVTAPGRLTWAKRIEIEPGSARKAIDVPPLKEATAPSDTVPKRHLSLSPRPTMTVAPESQLSKVGLAAFGVGVLGLAFGSYYGMRAIGQNKDADQYCSGRLCTQQGIEGHNRANVSAWLADAGFAIGVVGLAGGAYLTLSSRVARPGQGALWIQGGSGRIGVGGTF